MSCNYVNPQVVLQNMISPSPAAATMAKVSRKAEKKEKERKEEKRQRKKREGKYMQLGGLMVRANMIGGAADGPFGVADRIERVDRGGGAGGGDRETMCELCGNSFPHPVTYHMKEAHPGCGSHAGNDYIVSCDIVCSEICITRTFKIPRI